MQLILSRPIVFFDLETTGLNILTDRIVQICLLKVKPNGQEEEMTLLVNPEMHIPEDSTAIHHITDEMVATEPSFKLQARKISKFIEGCDLGGYNSNRFDVPMLAEEMLRAGVDFDIRNRKLVDVQNIYHKKEARTLSAAYRFYCNKELDGAHSADADTRATYEVLKAQLDKYDDLKNDVSFLQEFSQMNRNADVVGNLVFDKQDRPCFNFGKYKGRPVEEVFRQDSSYYAWIMDGQFAHSTKKVVTEIKLSMMKNSK